VGTPKFVRDFGVPRDVDRSVVCPARCRPAVPGAGGQGWP